MFACVCVSTHRTKRNRQIPILLYCTVCFVIGSPKGLEFQRRLRTVSIIIRAHYIRTRIIIICIRTADSKPRHRRRKLISCSREPERQKLGSPKLSYSRSHSVDIAK